MKSMHEHSPKNADCKETEIVLQDHLSSTSQLLDSASGTSKSRYDYKSYGKLEGDIDNRSLTNAYTYTGREDDGTGLMYYRARFYDPELEVFISEDPLGDAQRYVGGNPLKRKDPKGLWYWDANVSLGVGVGITTGIFISPQGLYPYAGGGIVSSPGGSLNYSPNDISPGLWSVQGAVILPPGGGGAAGVDMQGSPFVELGVGVPGFSLTGYYTVPQPLELRDFLPKRGQPQKKTATKCTKK